MKIDRLAGAASISQRAIAIGAENGIAVTECVWDMGEDLGHEYAHRLDLFTEKKTVRLYFPDLDLTTADNDARKERTEDRLRRAIAQLSTVQPSPTYPFR